MTTIHMDTGIVYEHGRQMMNTASELFKQIDALQLTMNRLRLAWNSPRADRYFDDWNRLRESLVAKAQELDQLAQRVMREVDEWITVDRTQSAYYEAYKKTFDISLKDVKQILVATVLATTLHWSFKRPNSIIFTGPNWMRKTLDIAEMTRVIKPTTLAKGMARVGAATSLIESGIAAWESFSEYSHEDLALATSAAIVDGAFKFAISAIGTVGIPLLLGTVVSTIGAPALVAGGIVLAGSVIGEIAYSKLIEAPLWEMWKNSTLRLQVIEQGRRTIDRFTNHIRALTFQSVQNVKSAFAPFIGEIVHSYLPGTS